MSDKDNIYRCVCGSMFVTERGLFAHKHGCEEVAGEKGFGFIGSLKVTSEQCKEFRKRIDNGESAKDISDDVEVSDTTVQYHVRGQCNHRHEEGSFTYIDSEWVRD